jgi:hypothetical protein
MPLLFSAGCFPVTAVACACRPASAVVCWARVPLEAVLACSLPVDEPAAAHSVEDSDAEPAHSAVAAQVRCAAAADDPFPDEAAKADSVVDDSSQVEVGDGCLAACCWDDRCVPVVPTGGSCRDDC